jgi:hypothetical protein
MKIKRMTLEQAKKAAGELRIGETLSVEITDAVLLHNKRLQALLCNELNKGRRDSNLLIANHGSITTFNRVEK